MDGSDLHRTEVLVNQRLSRSEDEPLRAHLRSAGRNRILVNLRSDRFGQDSLGRLHQFEIEAGRDPDPNALAKRIVAKVPRVLDEDSRSSFLVESGESRRLGAL